MAKAQSTTTRSVLSLNGLSFNLLSFAGGYISAEIVKENEGPEMPVKKRLASIRYEDIIFETAINEEVKATIKKAWNGEGTPSNGFLVTTDAAYKALYEDEFSDLLLIETIIPQCDGESRESGNFRLRMKPTFIRNLKGDGRVVHSSLGRRQKALLKSNFRFVLGGLPCSRIASIDSFIVVTDGTSTPKNSNVRGQRANATIDFPNLFLNISQVDLQPWLEWHKKFIVEGKNSGSDELSGRLVFLAPDLQEELLAIRLDGVGIFSLQPNADSSGNISRFRIGLYCERMSIEN